MFFSQEGIQNLAASYRTMNERAEALIIGFCSFKFKNERAHEFAAHGFARRIGTLTRCIENVFALLDPEDETIPTTETCNDATAYIQAFLFNVFGALDNLLGFGCRRKTSRTRAAVSLKIRV
jgi:hypothetical protein